MKRTGDRGEKREAPRNSNEAELSRRATDVFLRPVEAVRLYAVTRLHSNAIYCVKRETPQTMERLQDCFRPEFVMYAEQLLDAMAEYRLSTMEARVHVNLGPWLRSECKPAILDDICRPVSGQFLLTVKHVLRELEGQRLEYGAVTRRLLNDLLSEKRGRAPATVLKRKLAEYLDSGIIYWQSQAATLKTPVDDLPPQAKATKAAFLEHVRLTNTKRGPNGFASIREEEIDALAACFKPLAMELYPQFAAADRTASQRRVAILNELEDLATREPSLVSPYNSTELFGSNAIRRALGKMIAEIDEAFNIAKQSESGANYAHVVLGRGDEGNSGLGFPGRSSERSVSGDDSRELSIVIEGARLKANRTDKGNLDLLRSIDGELKQAVNLEVASRYGGVSRRAIEDAGKRNALKMKGKRHQRRVLVDSLLEYFPPEK